ncbi:MAG: hypothetical protein GC150_10540 [Rhizobiales bacterium]|nr:hypothetical protein [Hyphomicrobiales bacterium]
MRLPCASTGAVGWVAALAFAVLCAAVPARAEQQRLDPANPILVIPDSGPLAPVVPRGQRPLPELAPGYDRSRPPSRELIGRGASGIESAPLAPLGPSAPLDAAPAPSDQPRWGPGRLAPPVGRGAGESLAARSLGPDLWRGMTMADLERFVADSRFALRSPVMQRLWQRLMLSDSTPPAGGEDGSFLAYRMEALYRLGRIEEAAMLARGAGAETPLARAVAARALLARGEQEQACGTSKTLLQEGASLPAPLTRDIYLIVAHCAAVTVNPKAGLLILDLARERGVNAETAYEILDALSRGGRPRVRLPEEIDLIDGLFLALAGAPFDGRLVARATPAFAVFLAEDARDPGVRALAAERALIVGAADVAVLAAAYAEVGGGSDPVARRAAAYGAAANARGPAALAEAAADYLALARTEGLEQAGAVALGPLFARTPPDVSAAPYAEIAVEVLTRNGETRKAWSWSLAAGADGRAGARPMPWLALLDIVAVSPEVPRGPGLETADRLASAGALAPDTLHRLATVLDALDYNVPIPLWNAASRTPQPTAGHLPPTGVLSDLKLAAERRDLGRGLLLSLVGLGGDGPPATNLLALGDVIRGMRALGFEREARAIAFEAVVEGWPRAGAPR